MPKIGKFEIPDITLRKCLEMVEVINRQKGGVIARENLSVLLEMSSRGGQYSKLIKSCKSWGLIEGRDQYYITPLGLKILNPLNSSESIVNKKELILNILFFNELYSKYPNVKPNDTSLLQTIEEITDIDRFISLKHEKLIRRLLSEIDPIIQTITDEFVTEDPIIPLQIIPEDETRSVLIESSGIEPANPSVIRIISSGVDVLFQFNDEGINSAVSLLNSLKNSYIH